MTTPTPSISSILDRLTDAQKADLLSGEWYFAACNHCGWFGSSQECDTDEGPWGDSDVYCPKCGRSGADSGQLCNHESDIYAALLASEGNRS